MLNIDGVVGFKGTSVASGSLSGDVLVHSLLNSSVAPPKALRSPQTEAVRQVKYSPFHNSILGSCTDDGSVALWDVGMMRQVTTHIKKEKRRK